MKNLLRRLFNRRESAETVQRRLEQRAQKELQLLALEGREANMVTCRDTWFPDESKIFDGSLFRPYMVFEIEGRKFLTAYAHFDRVGENFEMSRKGYRHPNIGIVVYTMDGKAFPNDEDGMLIVLENVSPWRIFQGWDRADITTRIFQTILEHEARFADVEVPS